MTHARYRGALPQLSGDLFLTDAGLETDIIFNRGVDIREFAAHTLLADPHGREVMAGYFREFLELARERGVGFILDAATWKAHAHWADDLGETPAYLRQANHKSIAMLADLRAEFDQGSKPIVLNAPIGPRGDAYVNERAITIEDAADYHVQQLRWLAETEVDMVTAMTFTSSEEAAGFVRAATSVGLPSVVSFTVETDGRLPTGQAIGDAIRQVDDQTDGRPAYFMLNCAHPDHFAGQLPNDQPGTAWLRRIRGVRCNASRMSHAELDCSETLDAGDPAELGAQYGSLQTRMPWLNVFGGCCGSDIRHVRQIAAAVAA